MIKTRPYVILLLITSLTLGMLLYVALRDESIYINQWLSPFRDNILFHNFRDILQNVHFPYWVVYSLPDAIWMAGLTLLILAIWDFQINEKSIRWISLSLIVGLLFESMQAFHIIPGTYDTTDFLFILYGGLLPVSFSLLKS